MTTTAPGAQKELNLERFPRVRLAHLPTPIEPLEKLSAHLGGPALFVKRDDCTGGLGLFGNKVRKLEFVIAEALAAGARTIVSTGAVQSNHARQTAAACAKVGIDCVLVLKQNIQGDKNYYTSGNVLIDRLVGAKVHIAPASEDAQQFRLRIMDELTAAGRKPFFIPVGASTPAGSLGYVIAAAEIIDHCRATGLRLDHVAVASGSAGTQAGLLVGLRALGSPTRVLGITLDGKAQEKQEAFVWALVQETANLLGDIPKPIRSDVEVDSSYNTKGYAAVEDPTLEALQLLARLEGLILDPVYTAPAMAGLIGNIRKGKYRKDENVLFVHTGGMLGLFGYLERFVDRLTVS